jgi:hypothetical protein
MLNTLKQYQLKLDLKVLIVKLMQKYCIYYKSCHWKYATN